MSSAHPSSKFRRGSVAVFLAAGALFVASAAESAGNAASGTPASETGFGLAASSSSARTVEPSTAPVSAIPVTPSTPTIAVPEPNVDVSTVTGNSIDYDDSTGIATVEGDAVVETTTGTLKADKIVIDNNAKTGRASGHVEVHSASGTLTGREAVYDWATSTATIMGAVGTSPPWRFWADEMEQQSRNVYYMRNGAVTSCDLDPPHYFVRASNSNVRVGDRVKMRNARLQIDETPAFYFPFYTRSLKPKKYSIRIEPGNSSRDGFTNRTTVGYPFSANTYTKFRWDFLEKTGDGFGIEHRYFNPNIRGDIDGYYIQDHNPDEAPESNRYSILWNHYQKLTPRLTANAKLDFKSDQIFGNQFTGVGNDVRIENQAQGVLSEGGLNYQFPRSSLQLQVDRTDKFDSTVSSKSFISKLVLPTVTYNTIPIKTKLLPFYTSFSANYTNETLERTDPTQTLRYQRSAGSGVQVKRDIRVGKMTTFTPIASYQENWQDRDLSTGGASKDIYVGRYTAGTDLRRRLGRSIDTTFQYRYGERFQRNRTIVDTTADDRGVETHNLTASMVSRIGRNTRLTLGSGYDFRRAPRSDPSRFDHRAARLSPPTADVEYQASKTVTLFYRETYSLFDSINRKIVKTPLNTSGEVQVGNIAGRTFFSQGFSFTKPTSPDQPSDLLLTNKLRFYPSDKWHVDLFISYRATGPSRLNYRRVLPIEKTIRATRDLHCWVFRMEFSERPGETNASFYIDLKANLSPQRNLFAKPSDLPEAPIDVSDVFPERPAGR